ncbi:MAG: hypothetical protein SA339_00180 [Methanomassiliicoccus sp.]|nr:hypothetical protein [Methanomassiliicoccus sp.]
MNPDVPDNERSPAPKRKWRPLNEPERRTSELDLTFARSADGPSYEMQFQWSGH